jgi:hypothetical protein
MNLTALIPPGFRRDLEADTSDVARMLQHNPIGAIHSAGADTARRIYTESCGYAVAPNTRASLRRMNQAEATTLREEIDRLPANKKVIGNADYLELLTRKKLDLIAAGERQLVLELDRSGLVAVKVPTGAACSALDSLLRAGGAAAPCIESACRTYTTLFFARPAVEGVVRRRLEIDATADAVKPADDQDNSVPLPHAGVLERWVRLALLRGVDPGVAPTRRGRVGPFPTLWVHSSGGWASSISMGGHDGQGVHPWRWQTTKHWGAGSKSFCTTRLGVISVGVSRRSPLRCTHTAS